VRPKYYFATGYSKGFDLSNFMAASKGGDAVARVFFLQKKSDWSETAGDLWKEERLGNGRSCFGCGGGGCVALRRCLFGLLAGRREENIFSNDLQCMAAGYCGFASSLKKKKAPVNPLPRTHSFFDRPPFLSSYYILYFSPLPK
jgi:hypothetical protein